MSASNVSRALPATLPQPAPRLQPAGPLRERLPQQQARGSTLADFMVLIPGLRDRAPDGLARRIDLLREVLGRYSDLVVFADLNLQLNLLWVSVQPRPGATLEVAGCIRAVLPEARLVASQAECRVSMRRGFGRWAWRRKGGHGS
jgi:hypothetical protein